MDGMGYIALKNPLVCPKKGLAPIHFFSNEIGTPKTSENRSGGVWILGVGHVGRSHFLLGFHVPSRSLTARP